MGSKGGLFAVDACCETLARYSNVFLHRAQTGVNLMTPLRFSGIALAFFVSACVARGEPVPATLPPPLQAITFDLGVLAKHFDVAECKVHAAGEFTAGNRVAEEETIVWTLRAKKAMKGDEVFRLLHPNPPPSPFAQVQFLKVVEGKDASANARAGGYRLIRDLRWINPKAAPDLAAGEKLQVWVHLGREGSAGLLENKATKMLVAPAEKPQE